MYLVRFTLGFLAAAAFAVSGFNLVGIQTGSGPTDTLIHGIGIFAFGMALLVLALLVPSARSASGTTRDAGEAAA